MTRSLFVYMYLLVCLSRFGASTTSNGVDPRKIYIIFIKCDATYQTLLKCLIEDIDCIQNTYDQIKKDKHETTIYIHGYRGIPDSTSVPNVISAYCSRSISVIAIIDWSQLAVSDVMVVADRLPEVGKIIASTFNSLNNRGYETSKWHVIGHSMGAHVAGCIGTYSNITFSHITGLDPAGTFFYTNYYHGCRFNPNVAYFTDAFYTDRGVFGAPIDTGIVNIYANFGTTPQPGCTSLSDVHECSHFKAVEWYADAVRHETKYLATKCPDCLLIQRFGHCKGNENIYLGPHTNKKATGTYCLSVN